MVVDWVLLEFQTLDQTARRLPGATHPKDSLRLAEPSHESRSGYREHYVLP